jgi:Alpha/beta hydrolase domain containing 18
VRKIYKRWVENWDLKLANVSTDRVVRPFEWGLEWLEDSPIRLAEVLRPDDPAEYLDLLNRKIVQFSDLYYGYEPPRDFDLKGERLSFTSAVRTPFPANDHVKARWFPAEQRKDGKWTGEASKKAVIVLPHWNSQEHAHVGLAKLIQRLGLSSLRLSLPYHDRRMPAELHRADFAVSSNVGRTLAATRQAVTDIRSCVDWLQQTGHERIGIVGTSLGSCYSFLAAAHDPRLEVCAFNHCSAYFSDVVWTGLATRHIMESLQNATDQESLRKMWLAISPAPYIPKFGSHENRQSLFIYAKYDTSFLPEYSLQILKDIETHCENYKVAVLPCGHYTTGEFPYKFIDGYYIGRFLAKAFRD